MRRCALLVVLVLRVAGCGGDPEATAPDQAAFAGLPAPEAGAPGTPDPVLLTGVAVRTEEAAPPSEIFAADLAITVTPVEVARAFADCGTPWLQEFAFQAYRQNGWKPLFVNPHYSIEPVTELLRLVLAAHELGLDPFDFGLKQLLSLTRGRCHVDFADGEQVVPLESALRGWFPDAPASLLTVRCQPHWWPEAPEKYDARLSATYYKLAYALSGNQATALRFDGHEQAVSHLVSLLPHSRRYFARVAAFRRFMPYWSTASLPILGKWGSLEPGVVGPRVALLKRRLVAEGFMDRETYLHKQKIFDKPTREAVKAYRSAYSLSRANLVDRRMMSYLSLDAETYLTHLWRSLNTTLAQRLERGDAYILVNIPEFTTYWIEDGQVQAAYRSVVGFPYEEPGGRTPQVNSAVTYLDLNPEWVPTPWIVKNELGRKARKDPRFWAENRFVDKNGKLVQLPGPQNTLGQVVVAFGSEQNIYLHGTPEPKYFGYADRALSHGCVRVENIEDLGARILKWASITIEPDLKTVLKKVIEKRVELAATLPVYFIYDRVKVTQDGLVGLTPDPYKLNRTLVKDIKLDPLHTLMAMARKTRKVAAR